MSRRQLWYDAVVDILTDACLVVVLESVAVVALVRVTLNSSAVCVDAAPLTVARTRCSRQTRPLTFTPAQYRGVNPLRTVQAKFELGHQLHCPPKAE